MEMFNPPHPGEIIREDCLKPLDLSVTAAAKWPGVSRVTLSELLNGHNGVNAEMAIRRSCAWPNPIIIARPSPAGLCCSRPSAGRSEGTGASPPSPSFGHWKAKAASTTAASTSLRVRCHGRITSPVQYGRPIILPQKRSHISPSMSLL